MDNAKEVSYQPYLKATRATVAARYRLEDHGNRNSRRSWYQRGTIADVVTALLALPSKGKSNAWRTTNRASGYVWLPPPTEVGWS